MTKPIYKHDIGIFQKLVEPELCESLISFFENVQDVGRIASQPDRDDLSKHFEFSKTQDLKKLKIHLINSLREYALRYTGLNHYGLVSNICKIQRTPLYGGFHNWHHEHNLFNKSENRVLVWMLYLNDLDQGDGTTEFVYQNLEVQPEQGTLLIWPAYFNYLHRGNPPRKKIKYISTGWWDHVKPQHPYNELKTDVKWVDPEDYFTV